MLQRHAAAGQGRLSLQLDPTPVPAPALWFRAAIASPSSTTSPGHVCGRHPWQHQASPGPCSVMTPTSEATSSLMTMFPILSSSSAREVRVVDTVATFSTVRAHSRRSSSQAASPAFPGFSSRNSPGSGAREIPKSSLEAEGADQGRPQPLAVVTETGHKHDTSSSLPLLHLDVLEEGAGLSPGEPPGCREWLICDLLGPERARSLLPSAPVGHVSLALPGACSRKA